MPAFPIYLLIPNKGDVERVSHAKDYFPEIVYVTKSCESFTLFAPSDEITKKLLCQKLNLDNFGETGKKVSA